MQYLLTQEEMSALRAAPGEVERRLKADLLDLCIDVAKYKPVVRDWEDEGEPLRPWGCILLEGEDNSGYCDECPVSGVCPHTNKAWSK